MLDKEGRVERKVKRRTNEKHPCRNAQSSSPAVISTACLPPSLALCPYANTSPPKSGKLHRSFGSMLSNGDSSLKKVWPLLLRRKAQERRNIFSQHTQ